MLDVALDVGNAPAGVAFVPGAVELFCCGPELHNEVAGQVLRLSLAALLLPKANEGRFIAAHNYSGIRAADERTAVLVGFVHTFDFMLSPASEMASANRWH